MIIKSIELENWRSHNHTKLLFSKGTNMLIGIMGAGKSSVLEAICFALYGTIPAVLRRKIKLSEIVSKNADGSQAQCKVVLEFVHKGETYEVSRTIVNGKSSAEFRKDGRLIEAKSDAVTNMITNILGVNYDLFTRAIYAEQNQLDYLLTLNPSERKKQIDSLIGMDKFELARSNTLKAANRMSRDISVMTSSLSKYDQTKIKDEKDKLIGEIQKNDNEIKAIDEKLGKVVSEINGLESKLSELETKRREYELMSKKIIECQTYIQEMSNNLKRYDEGDLNAKKEKLDVLRTKIDEKTGVLKTLEQRMAELNMKIGTLRNVINEVNRKNEQVKTLEKELSEIKCDLNREQLAKMQKECNENIAKYEKLAGSALKEMEFVEKQYNQLKSNVEEIEEVSGQFEDIKKLSHRELEIKKGEKENCISWIASLNEIIKMNQDAIDKLKKDHKGVCPVCDTMLNEKKITEIINKKSEVIKESEKELKSYKDKLTALNEEITEYEKKLDKRKEFESLVAQLPEKRRELGEAAKRREVIKKDVEKYKNELSGYEQKLKEIEPAMRNAEKIERIKSAIEEINSYLEENKNADADLEKLLNEQKELSKKINLERDFLKTSEKNAVELETDIRDIEHNIQLKRKVDDKKSELAELEKKVSELNYDEDIYKRMDYKRNELKIEAEGLKAKKEGYVKNLALLNNSLSYVNRQIEEINKLESEIKHMSSCVNEIKLFQQALVETQIALRNELVNSINTIMKKVWKAMYPYGDIVEVRMAATENDYILQAKRGDEWVNAEGNMSGGERASMVLCLRIALSIVLAPQMNLLVLDEPTHNIDENGINALVQIMHDKLPNIIEQTFVITHDDALKEGASGRLYIFNRAKDRYEATSILETS